MKKSKQARAETPNRGGRPPLSPEGPLDAAHLVRERRAALDHYRELGIDLSATARAAWAREAKKRAAPAKGTR